MTKLILNNVGNLLDTTTAATTLNNNSAAITNALENTFSRDGTSPNQLQSDVDMNGFQIQNLPTPGHPTSPLRLQDLSDFNAGGTIIVSVDNADGTLNVSTSPEGLTTVSLNTAHPNTWTGQQTLTTPILGTPASGTLTNATGLPISTGVSGLGAGVATFLGTPTSANLRTALTDETGTGPAVFATSPALTTPTGIVKGDVGLGNVDNTSDVTKNAASVTLTNKTISGASNTISAVALSSLATQAANTLVANNTGSTASPTAVTLSALATVNVVKIQKFTAGGTYTPSTGLQYCIIECLGAGGGGGGVAATGASVINSAGGGGAGGYSRLVASAATIGASKAVTIGTAGTGASAGNNAGGAGGDTSVTTICVGKGGSGGSGSATSAAPGGAGGVAGTGDVTGTGATGQSGPNNESGLNTVFAGGTGASSSFGGGGIGGTGVNTTTAGAAATGFGSGGGGGGSGNSSGAAAGGAGTAGLVIITEYCNQ